MDSFKTCSPCVEARDWATSQIEWTGGDSHLFYFEMLEQDLHDTAMEIHLGTGRRFKAFRLQIQMAKRRLAAQQQQAA
jgi:hypothetical protein